MPLRGIRKSAQKSPPILSHEFVIQNHADIVSCLAMLFVLGLMFQVGMGRMRFEHGSDIGGTTLDLSQRTLHEFNVTINTFTVTMRDYVHWYIRTIIFPVSVPIPFISSSLTQATSPLAQLFVSMGHNVTLNASESVEGVPVTFYAYGVKDVCAVFFYSLVAVVMHAVFQV